MTEAEMMHGVDWSGENLTGWYLTEKLDGCRGEWDGMRFWSRNGRVVNVPGRIVEAMPSEPVSGEFWAGRGRFRQASNAVRIGGIHWAGVEFVAFDHPGRRGDWIERNGRGIICHDNRHAAALMREIIALGGEGLVAFRPGIEWHAGRSNDIIKIKQGR